MSDRQSIFLLSSGDEESYSPLYLWTWRTDVNNEEFNRLVKSSIVEIIESRFKFDKDPFFYMSEIIEGVWHILIAKHGFMKFSFDGSFHTYNHHISGFGTWRKVEKDEINSLKKLGLGKSLIDRILKMNKIKHRKEMKELKEWQEKKKLEENKK